MKDVTTTITPADWLQKIINFFKNLPKWAKIIFYVLVTLLVIFVVYKILSFLYKIISKLFKTNKK